MKVWTNNKFNGHWPVGTAAVVVADTAERAAEILNDDLGKRGLDRSATAEQFERLSVTQECVRVLRDGEY